jgi:lambda family phage tail tape measure protein
MAEQILKVKLVADVGQSEAALKLFTDSAKDAGVSIEKVFKAVNVETDKIAYDIKVTADELDKLDKAFKSAKAKFSEDETTKLSSSFVEVTKNIDAEAARIAKSRQKGFEEDLAKRTTRLKESLNLELALIREGENSITAIKLESASKQRKLEEKLQEDLAAVKQKFIDQDITAATKNTYINRLYADYKDATVKLNELTDERIAKANQEVADFNLVEKKLAETSARRVKLVEDREKALTDIQIAAAKKSQEVQNALIKQTVDALIVTEDKEYKRLLAARKANAEAAFGVGAPQASRDDRGYVPFAMGTVGGNRAADLTTMQKLAASSAYSPDAEKLKIARGFSALSLMGSANNKGATETITESLSKQNTVLDESIRKHKSLGTHIAEVIGIYRIYNAAINLTEQALLSIPKALINLQSSTASLTATFGTAAAAARELEFLNEEGKRTGVSVNQLRKSYADFAASLLMAGESAETLRRVFSNVNTIATTLHMTTDAVDSTFLALAQSFNKGKIQAEEMVKQLAQRLPGIYNQAAVALGMTTRQLGEEMKKGLVEAHGNIDAIVALLAKTFGGEAFRKASTGLNAELGRLTGSWTLFAENVGKASEETMSNFVRNLTAVLDKLVAFTSNTQSLQNTLNTFFNMLAGAAAGSLVAYTGNIALATRATVTFERALLSVGTVLKSNIFTIGMVGLGLLIGKLVAAKEATISLEDRITEVLRKSLAAQGKTLNEYNASQNQAVKSADELIKYQEDKLKGLADSQRTLQQQYDQTKSKGYLDRLAKVNQEVLIEESTLRSLKADREKTYKEALVSPQETYKAGAVEPATSTTEQKKALTEIYKTSLEEAKNAAKQIQSDLTEALGSIDILYQQNAMSIETYFSQKMQLQETDLAVQKEMLNQELQLAYAQKDKVKIQKLNGELIKAETDANKLATKTIIEKTDATRAYQAMALEGQAKVLAFQGRGGEAALGQFDVANRDKLEKFKIAGDTAALRNLEIERQNVALKGAIADIDEKRTLQEADYQAALERTNILKNTGAIGEFTALQQITAANEARIASMEEAVRIKELEIAKTEELVGVVDLKERSALKKLREELENFRLTSDAVAQHFDKVFSDSFTNAFTGFANGTMTAKQAFSSLITSMIGEIQKLIAQEMASAALKTIIRPLANWAMGGIGDMFSSGQSAAFTDTFSKSGTDFWGAGATKIWPNANGGVFSGSGISAYSGSIVSKPTIFPFAKGTGLMGEAGPEAILPLTRNSKGKLGVSADSTGQSGSNVYNIEVTVQSSKDEKPADTGQKIAEAMMRTIAKQEIGLAARPGNSLNRTTKFG